MVYNVNGTNALPDQTFDVPVAGSLDLAGLDLALSNYNSGVFPSNAYSLFTPAQTNALAQSGIGTGIAAVTNSPNAYGLYSLSQVEALNVGNPLLQKNATNGLFTLTIGVQKATNLLDFLAFPMNTPGTGAVIDSAGNLEFTFPGSNNAAFFRLQSH